MNHSFDIEEAEKYGIPAAILLDHFRHWITKNRANDKHFRDGRTWSYNSVKAFTELYPYMGIKQIRSALDKLVEEGVLLKRDWNEGKADRTLWYAFRNEEAFIGTRGHLPKKANGVPKRDKACAENGKCTISTATYATTYTESAPSAPQDVDPVPASTAIVLPTETDPVKRVFEHWKRVMNHPASHLDAKRRSVIQDRMKEGYSADHLILAIDGCAKSAWHMGQNDKSKVYDSLDLICRDASKVDGFMADALRKPAPAGSAAGEDDIHGYLQRRQQRGQSDDPFTIDMEA